MNNPKEGRRRVLLVVKNHTLAGDLSLEDQRLSDLLNDVRYSYIELHKASFSHVSNPGRVVHRTSLATIPKAKVEIAFELAENPVANTQRPFRYQEKRRYSVFFAGEDIEVQGTLHAKLTEGPPSLSRLQERWFVPLTNASVNFCAFENCSFRQAAVLVNLRDIQYFALDTAELPTKRNETNST